jgi:hypothetical protein
MSTPNRPPRAGEPPPKPRSASTPAGSTPAVSRGSGSQRVEPPRAGSQPVRKSTPKPAPKPVASMQIVFGSILAISLLLAINFSGRIAAGQRIQAELTVIEATIRAEQMKATAFKQQYDFVSSDAFIEQWARGPEAMMIKPGEILVIPVPGRQDPQPTATPFVPRNTTELDGGNQNWKQWWQLFFDSAPPGGY